MGETRARKSKKPSKKTVVDVSSDVLNEKVGSLNIDNIEAPYQTCVRYRENRLPSKELAHNNDHGDADADINANFKASGNDDDDDWFHTDPDIVKVQMTEDKGVAIFAARKIPAGTLILAEKPLIRLTQAQEDDEAVAEEEEELDKKSGEGIAAFTTTTINRHNDNDTNTLAALDKQFRDLSKSAQKSYLALFDSHKSSFSRIKSIYYSNCYNLSGPNQPCKSSPGGSCIGQLASRINHSCVPNSQFSFDEDHGMMLFFAIKAIPRGREITSNYDSIFGVTTIRHKRQMLYYGFTCDCEACTAEGSLSEFWAKSDERRKAMIEMRKAVRECEKQYDRTFAGSRTKTEAADTDRDSEKRDTAEKLVALEAMTALERLESLLVKEGIVGLPLANTYRDLAKWTERAGGRSGEDFKKWTLKELHVSVTCMGSRCERVRDLKAKMYHDSSLN